MEPSGHCPICGEMYAESSPPTERGTHYRCMRCGEFILTNTAIDMLDVLLKERPKWRTLLSYSGQMFSRESSALIAVAGSINYSGLNFMMDHLKQSELVTFGKDSSDREFLILTMKGWERYEEIRRGNIDSKKAFMAMDFGNPTLDKVYKHFKVAIEQTGFDLRRIDERPKAGLIDDRLRVEIITSRFLIADLTKENRGAYWEAGFAEGLGRPVIYTCKKAHFNHASTHFDTNHHLTVQWEVGKIDKALDELKAIIRVTLPDEAKLQD